MSKHTPGRVKLQHPHAGERGWEVAFQPGLEQLCQNITKANARRLVVCWNACEGIDTEYLEGDDSLPHYARRLMAQRDELLEALKVMLRDYTAVHDIGGVEMQPAIYQARAAIERAHSIGGDA